MTLDDLTHLHALLDRITRLVAARGWSEQLNPVQRAALEYLSLANRFSRAPSHVADYLASTRGTVSQTLRSLERKGFVSEQRSDSDRRRTSYEVTDTGRAALRELHGVKDALGALPEAERARLTDGLMALLSQLLAQEEARRFGMCRTCRHHVTRDGAPYCTLLDEALGREEALQICHEHAA